MSMTNGFRSIEDELRIRLSDKPGLKLGGGKN